MLMKSVGLHGLQEKFDIRRAKKIHSFVGKYLSSTLIIIEDTVVNNVMKSPYIPGPFVSWRKQPNKIRKIHVR